MDIFSSAAGVVTAIDSVGVPVLLTIGDDPEDTEPNANWGGLEELGAIITGIKDQEQGGFQFRHTLMDFVYLYVFGERVGQLGLEGLAFAEQCQALGGHGIEQVHAYYLDNRVTERPDPITIVLGLDLAFHAFLTGFNFDLSDTERGITRFNLTLYIIPEANSHLDPGGGDEDHSFGSMRRSMVEFARRLQRDATLGTQPPPTTGTRELSTSILVPVFGPKPPPSAIKPPPSR